jgi:multiple sugar transport system substrate-binding protein
MLRASHGLLLIVIAVTAWVVLPPRLKPAGQAELLMTVWGMPFEDLLFEEGFAREYERQHPGVRVNYQRYPVVMDKYTAWHAVGRGADVMRMGIDNYHVAVARGMLAPLEGLIDDPELGLTAAERADFFPQLWDALELDGRRYALPSDNAQYGLYYNRALFDAYNAAHPDAPLRYPDETWTWEDLRRAARRLTERDERGRLTQIGLAFDLWSWPFLAFHLQAGGEVWDAEGTTALVNGPAGVEAMEFLADLLPPGVAVRSPEMADTGSDPHVLFKAGKLALMLDGSWRAPNVEIDAPRLDFAIAPLPHHRRRAVISGSVLWCVSAHTADPAAAWQMVKWLAAREQALRYWDTLRVAPPALLSVVQGPEFRSTGGMVEQVDGRAVVRVPPMPPEKFDDRAAWLLHAITPDPQTGERPGRLVLGRYQRDLEINIQGAISAVVKREQSAQAALDAAVAATHAIIDRDRMSRGLPPVERAGR